MIVPDPRFRPNPARAIYVQGNIDQDMVHRLTPNIIALQNQSRDPISVYIDSPGGNISSLETLLRLLQASNQDFANPCHIITVVTSRAASAAADLLSSGNYAIAYPESSILYHGIRTFQDKPLTVQTTSTLNQILRLNNDTYAMKLARGSEFRFMFRFMSSKSENNFEEIRQKHRPKEMTDLDCFLSFVSDRISWQARKIVESSRKRHKRYEALLNTVVKRMKEISRNKRLAQTEGLMLKAIIDFEIRSNKRNLAWTFKESGLIGLSDDFFLLDEYITSFESEQFKRLAKQWGKFVLSEADSKEIERAPEANRDDMMTQKVTPHLQPLWAFFVALCHALQEGDYNLTATDAFWLGLIDEVMGAEGLPPFRLVWEHKSDAPVESQKKSEEKTENITKEKTDETT